MEVLCNEFIGKLGYFFKQNFVVFKNLLDGGYLVGVYIFSGLRRVLSLRIVFLIKEFLSRGKYLGMRDKVFFSSVVEIGIFYKRLFGVQILSKYICFRGSFQRLLDVFKE